MSLLFYIKDLRPPVPTKRQTSIKFNRTKQVGVNPELAHLYRTWQLEEGLP